MPIKILSILLALPYFSLDDSLCTKPTDVPAISTKKLCPKEYNSKSNIPHSKLPSFATIASNTTKTGVAQGDEKNPPKTPARNAPEKPRLVFLLIA